MAVVVALIVDGGGGGSSGSGIVGVGDLFGGGRVPRWRGGQVGDMIWYGVV